MNDNISRDEIKKRLKKLNDPWLSTAFATRMAAYALPALADGMDRGKPFLWFWNKGKRQKYLLAVLLAWQCAWCAALFKNEKKISIASADAFAFFALCDAFASRARASRAASRAAAVYADADAYVATRVSRASVFAATDAVSRVSRAAAAAAAAADAAVAVADAASIHLYIKNYIQFLEKNPDSLLFLTKPFGDDLLSESALFITTLRKWKAQGFDYWADWYEARLRGEPLDKEIAIASCLLPDEILAGSPAEINSYLKSLQNKSANISLNRVRVIFIGYGASGKTSLIRVLHGETVVEGKGKMTPGIDIHEWPVPEAAVSFKTDAPKYELTAHLWDFGGQVMAHATHQFFLRSRCLYVLVMDGRSEIKADEQAEYWLEHVRAFGGNAPVMIVGNKADLKVRLNLDMGYLCEKYPNIVDFYRLSCTHCKGDEFKYLFEQFHRDFVEQLYSLAEKERIKFTRSHFKVLEDLRKESKKEPFLPKKNYKDICCKHGIQETGDLDQKWLLELLDRLGEVIHFPNLPFLGGYLLNPRWLTYGVYHLLYSEKSQQQNGDLTDQMVVRILCDGEFRDNLGNALCYTPEQCRFIIDALEKFEIGFRMETNRLLIPALMPSDTPEHGFNKKDALAFDFDCSGFLPRHLIPGFIVQCHYDIDCNVDNGRNSVWQKGVLLCSRDMDATALAQADYHERRLSLWVRGPQASRYFSVLHEKIIVMLRRMKDLQYTEWVPGGDQSRRADFRDLLAMEAAGEDRYICRYGIFSLAEVLKIMPVDKRQPGINIENYFTEGGYMGDNILFDGNKNMVVNLKSQLENVQQSIQNFPAESSEKVELEKLIAQLHKELEKVPEEKADYIKHIATSTNVLLEEAQKPEPNKVGLQITGEGLIKAAEALTTVAPKALDLVKKIVPMVTGLGG